MYGLHRQPLTASCCSCRILRLPESAFCFTPVKTVRALLLIGIAWLQRRSVPAAAVDASPVTRKDRLQTWGLLLV